MRNLKRLFFNPITFLTLVCLAPDIWAQTQAYYRHHQLSSTTSLEASLVNREIGIDASARNCIVGKKANGTVFHGICKEMDTASLNGVLNVTGQINGSSALKLSLYNQHSIPFFGSGGLVSEDATNFTFNDATNRLAVNKITVADSVVLTAATASRLLSTNANKLASSVSDLTSWIAGTANQITSTSDGDGTLTLSLPSAVTLPGSGTVTTTLGVTGKLTGSDSVVALLGLRIGTNANLLWASDNMISIPDSVTVDGVVRVGTRLRIGSGTPTYQTKRITAIGNSFDNTAIQMENTDVTLDADGRIYNLGITDASATDGRLDLTIPGVRTILSAWKSGNVGIGSTTDGGEVFQVTGTSRFTGAGAFGSTLGVTGKLTGSDTIAASLGFRAGSAGATDAQLYRSGANMWTTPDSLTVAGRLAVTGTAAITGTVTADSLISTKFYTEDSYTGTLTGVSGSVTGTIRYTRIGKQVTIEIPQLIGTSNSTSCTITGMPAAIRPARRQGFSPLCIMDNTSVSGSVLQGFYVETDGTLALVWQGLTTGFTSSGTKGFLASIDQNNNVATMAFTYTLQ